jgi:hypothetical protein
MSGNTQTLIVKHKGRFYVFTNIMAESWCEVDENDEIIEGRNNELKLKSADGVYNSIVEAYKAALKIDAIQGQFEEGTEYGVVLDKLIKDNSKVNIVD